VIEDFLQRRFGNSVEIVQNGKYGEGNYAALSQRGFGNEFEVHMEGRNNRIVATQYGVRKRMKVTLSGEGQRIYVKQ